MGEHVEPAMGEDRIGDGAHRLLRRNVRRRSLHLPGGGPGGR